VIAYKFLGDDRVAPFTRFQWPKAEWVEAEAVEAEAVEACRSGVHACRPRQLPYWLGRELWDPGSAAQVAHSPRNLGGDLRKRRTARAYDVYLGTGIRAGQRPVAWSSGSAAGRLKMATYTMTLGIIGGSGGRPSDHAACGDAGQRAVHCFARMSLGHPVREPNRRLTCMDAGP
jgi:hypothetical protein